MILQELVKYYERKLEEGEMAPEGFEYKEIPYLIEIDEDGNFIRFISTWQDEKKKRAKIFLIPKAVKRANGIESNLLWDNASYIFGMPDIVKLEDIKKKGKEKEYNDRLLAQKESFLNKVQKLEQSKIVKSICKFMENTTLHQLSSDENWKEIQENNPNLTFKLKNELNIVSENKEMINAIVNYGNKQTELEDFCLVSGEKSQIARLHPSIKGVKDAQGVGANIVSFNLKAFESYGKEQSYNAPVSEKVAFSYTTSLNTLLSKDSHQKIQIGDATTVFWSEKKSELEDIFGGLIIPNIDNKKAQEAIEIEEVKDFYTSPFSGKLKELEEDKTKFFILGLSPNAARISIRFWYPSTVGEISRNIGQHFADLKLEVPKNDSGVVGLNRILRSTALQGKLDNINPLLAGRVMTSIISGSQYPRLLLSSILIRIKAEHKIDFVRVSIIKAILNRKMRLDKGFINSINNLKELKETMDESNVNVAYRLGRLFAVMEKMQQNAIGGNTTIKDGYYTSASTRPATVFGKLFALSNHHASKLGNKSIWYEKLKGEILEPLNGNIPRTFSLEEQGLFAIGYYQQRNELFKGKEDKEGDKNE